MEKVEIRAKKIAGNGPAGQIKKEEMMIKEGGLTGNSTIQFPVFYYIIRGYKMVNKL